MQPESSQPSNADTSKGLPVVVPLTGRYVAQLFLVPGIIVALALLILVAFNWLAGGSRTPAQFLENLDNTNEDIRWRAASDLAQVLARDDRLASNPWFGLELCVRLRKALDDYEREAKNFQERLGKRSEAEQKKDEKTLRAKRNYVLYLGACLGNMSIPVGAPLLAEAARKDFGADEMTTALFRRRAVWALVHLGENLKRLSSEQRESVLEELRQEISSGSDDRRQWATATYDYLESRQSLGVIPCLVEFAAADDYFLREVTAFALGVWEGNDEENALAEKTLLTLSGDRGTSRKIEIKDPD